METLLTIKSKNHDGNIKIEIFHSTGLEYIQRCSKYQFPEIYSPRENERTYARRLMENKFMSAFEYTYLIVRITGFDLGTLAVLFKNRHTSINWNNEYDREMAQKPENNLVTIAANYRIWYEMCKKQTNKTHDADLLLVLKEIINIIDIPYLFDEFKQKELS